MHSARLADGNHREMNEDIELKEEEKHREEQKVKRARS